MKKNENTGEMIFKSILPESTEKMEVAVTPDYDVYRGAAAEYTLGKTKKTFRCEFKNL